MNQERARKAKYPDLYGTSSCPGADLARATSMGRGPTLLRGRIGANITKRVERRDASALKGNREMVVDRFVRSAKDVRFSSSRYERNVRMSRDLMSRQELARP